MDEGPQGRRGAGEGSVDELPSGRFRARVRFADGHRESLGTFATRAEAEHAITAALGALEADDAQVNRGAVTLRARGPDWLQRREVDGDSRNAATERSYWHNHVAAAEFADLPLAEVTALHVKRWLRDLKHKRATVLAPRREGDHAEGRSCRRACTRRGLSRQTRVHCLNLLRRFFGDAVEDGLVASNPAAEIRVKKEPQAEEKWTFLAVAEIAKVEACKGIPESAKLLYTFAVYQGLRAGELWALDWTDVTLEGDRPEVRVARSHKGATKGGKVHRIPLLERARVALARWWALRGRPASGLVFPTETGCQRLKGDDAGWSTRKVRGVVRVGHCALAGIARRVRFHDLRHTCASHLIMGSWGRAWSLSEVCAFLRHSNISVTQRYAHLSPEHLHNTAAQTARVPGGSTGGGGSDGGGEGVAAGSRVGHAGEGAAVRMTTSPLKNQGAPGATRTHDIRLRRPQVSPESPTTCERRDPSVTQRLARLVLEAAETTGIVPRELADALAWDALTADPVARLALALLDEATPFDGRRVLELAGLVLERARAATASEAAS